VSPSVSSSHLWEGYVEWNIPGRKRPDWVVF